MQKKENNNKESLSKAAFSLFKNGFSYSLPTTFGISILILSILTFGIFFPAFMWVGVPFLILPLLFAYTLSLSDGHEEGELSNRRTITYFLSYFRTPFYGSYRVIRNFFLSLFWSTVFSIILYFSLAPIFSNLSDGFSNAFKTFGEYIGQRNYESAIYLIENSESLSSFFFVLCLLDSAFFSLCFLFFLLRYSLNPFFRLRFGYGPSHISNHIFVDSLRNRKGEYMHDLFTSTWWFILLFVGFFALGIAIGWIYLNGFITPQGIVVFALGIGFLAISPFLSYYVCLLNLMNKKYETTFVDYYLRLAEETFLAAKEANELSEEETEFYQEQIEQGKKKKSELEANKREDEIENDDKTDRS